MGPTIILDKSSIQSLSVQELDFLYRYYTINITPVLIVEILGDLMKPDKDGALTGKQVTQLANKLLQMDSAINEDYRKLLVASLMGEKIIGDGRTVVGRGKWSQEPDGKKGVVFKESEEEQAIHRWRVGLFSEAEAILSKRWRESTEQIDLEQLKAIFKPFAALLPKTDTFTELVVKLDILLFTPNFQTQALAVLLHLFPVNPTLSSAIFHRWEGGQSHFLKDFAPYAFYCFRATLSFYLGLVRNFIGTRSTNQVDLEYTYYLPFADVFSSRDNFHKTFIPVFLRDDQIFVHGDDLKVDLKTIAAEWNSLNPEQQTIWLKENGRYPPQKEESVTFKLWQKYAQPRERITGDAQPSGGKSKARDLMDRINRLEQQAESSPPFVNEPDGNDIDFIVRERTISVNDPCPCGSGKKFKDCHLNQGS